MKMITRAMLYLMVLCQPLTSNAQYLRDSTRVIGLKKGTSDAMNLFSHYAHNEQFSLTLHPIFNIPEIEVDFGGVRVPLLLDFGNSGNILITNSISNIINYAIRDTIYTYTPIGEVRGIIESVTLPKVALFGEEYKNVSGSVANWSIFSTEPINGIVGLDYLVDKCFTLSYGDKIIGISAKSITESFPSVAKNGISLESYALHPTGVYFKGIVNSTNAIVYFDTGKSHTMINADLLPCEMISTDKSGSYFQGEVSLVFGPYKFSIYYPRVKQLKRNIDTELPVGIEVGSDILKYFLITIDRTGEKNNLIILK